MSKGKKISIASGSVGFQCSSLPPTPRPQKTVERGYEYNITCTPIEWEWATTRLLCPTGGADNQVRGAAR